MPAGSVDTLPAGLTSAEAAARLRRDGPNVLPSARGPSPVRQLLAQLTHFFALMLWVAAGLAVVAGLAQLAVAICVVVVLNGLFAFAQEYRADRATARLRELLPAAAQVLRDGHRIAVGTDQLVAGDVVLLSAGDRISADLSVAHSDQLAVDESMLTGESGPVRPGQGTTLHAGTFVVEGTAYATVTATGARTRLAGIADLTRSAHRRTSPLALQLHRVVRTVAVIAIAVGAGFYGLALLLGATASEGFLFAIGVTVALVPEGLLPTVTLSLARAAQRMAHRNALVRRLEAVESLGATTFICTDKTGTLTRNEMSCVEVWTPAGRVTVTGTGYDPHGELGGSAEAVRAAGELAAVAVRCVLGRAIRHGDQWVAEGDPTEVAVDVFAARCGLVRTEVHGPAVRRFPFDPRRRRSAVLVERRLHVLGAPDSVLARCDPGDPLVREAGVRAAELADRGLRMLAVAWRPADEVAAGATADEAERDLRLLGLMALEDAPRAGVADAIARCRRAGIRLAMITGDAPGTARAIARETGLLGPLVTTGAELPADDDELGALLDHDGVVVARVTPEDKLRIAKALQTRGHVVAMTGDGVNDGPALRQADIGVAMGSTGTDVAREAADLVLLDDRFETIVAAVELGRATFVNVRRFLTYHLTDNVAELTPFVVWALSAGRIPLALTVLQVLALDIGTDLLPALALGAEPPNPVVLDGPQRGRSLIDGPLLRRAFGVLGPAEALTSMAAFTTVLMLGGWSWGEPAAPGLLATASGTAFAAVVLGQLANAYACRSESRWAGLTLHRHNPLLHLAVGIELLTLLAFVGIPALSDTLGGGFPSVTGWLLALCAVPVVVTADALHKRLRLSRTGAAAGRSAPAAPRRG
jgi:magnesium-transporting ATPase (P-type)